MKNIFKMIHPERYFDSYAEAKDLEEKISELKKQKKIEEVAVATPEHPLLEEHWYRDNFTGEIYRYCPPEFPARGTWEPISNVQNDNKACHPKKRGCL